MIILFGGLFALLIGIAGASKADHTENIESNLYKILLNQNKSISSESEKAAESRKKATIHSTYTTETEAEPSSDSISSSVTDDNTADNEDPVPEKSDHASFEDYAFSEKKG